MRSEIGVQTSFVPEIDQTRYNHILPKQEQIIGQVQGNEINIDQYAEIINEILLINNSLIGSRKDVRG